MSITRFSQFVDDLLSLTKNQEKRHLIFVCGEQHWAQTLLSSVINQEKSLCLGEFTTTQSIPINQVKSVLGSEFNQIIFNAYSGFNPDAFGQCVGTLVRGGNCFVICPPFDQWPDFEDPDHLRYVASPLDLHRTNNFFIQRVIDLATSDRQSLTIEQGKPLPTLPHVSHNQCQPTNHQQQDTAIEAIKKTVYGHRNRPLVITADRGRGKSSALGIASAQLLTDKLSNIIISAPKTNAVDCLFKHASLLLAGATRHKTALQWQGKHIQFIAPDELIETLPTCDLLLIDEAAAIPTDMLTTIALNYSRVAFSTTIHGYEGTGRGFSLRFLKKLNSIAPQWRHCELTTPIRWGDNDPLEQLSNQILGLDCESVDPSILDKSQWSIQQLSQQDLLHDSRRLNQVFALLVLAHYQSKPSDFRQILDAPDLKIFTVEQNQQVIATALVVLEGNLPNQLTEDITNGKRRLRGHLLPQSLLAQIGITQTEQLSYARIMRIAVHPKIQHQGLGKTLNQFICQWANESDIDFVGASFGATTRLSQHWLSCGYQPIRLGLTKDSASGTNSLLVLKAIKLNQLTEQVVTSARHQFKRALQYALPGHYSAIAPSLIALIISSLHEQQNTLIPDFDQHNISNYLSTDRPLEQVDYLIKELLFRYAEHLLENNTGNQLLVRKILQQHDWAGVSKEFKLSGKKQAQQLVKQSLKELLSDIDWQS